MQFIVPLRHFERTQEGPVWGGNVGSRHLKCRLDAAAWVLPGAIKASESCPGCNEGLAMAPAEVGVGFIALWSRFDRTQGPVCRGKVGSRHLKCLLDSAA